MATTTTIKNISVQGRFWDALTKNSDSLALSQLWLACFDRDKMRSISKIIGNQLHNVYEPGMWNYSQSQVENVVMNDVNFFGTAEPGGDAYLLSQGAGFIADGLNNSRVGLSQSGAMKGLIMDGRLDLNASNITFLETNVSFVDGFLRPWAALVGHKSIKNSDLRLNIKLLCLEKWASNSPLRVRKYMHFRNAVPINIDAEEYNYSGDKLILRQVQFAFDRYDMFVNPDISDSSVTAAGALRRAKILPNNPGESYDEKQRAIEYITLVTPSQSSMSQTNAESQAKLINVSPDNLEMGDAIAFVDEKISQPSVLTQGAARHFYNEVTPKSVSHEAISLGGLIKTSRDIVDFEFPNTASERILKNTLNDVKETKRQAQNNTIAGEESMIMEDADFELKDPAQSTITKASLESNANVTKPLDRANVEAVKIIENSRTTKPVDYVLVEPTQSAINASDLESNPNIIKRLDRANEAVIKSTGSSRITKPADIVAQNISTGSNAK